ncbi:Imm48 family immunity protein [Clostridium sp. DJ247]|uniref:Imm48 family immunity protein n=1 Tax=Clostridium sp. DJ247 TaxID=2726188 RepID=UPI001623B977|nr:Imm48 family immunity protein [Clostridium sp. DJ247]MBC2580552.1 hypothetical protein [Clostridium sp. DJ247]
MSDFFKFDDLEKQKIDKAKDEIVTIAKDVFSLIGVRFENTTELERQVIAVFCFGIANAIVMTKDINHIQIHAITSTMLTNVFRYSEEQADDFIEELINATEEGYHPVMYSIIGRGVTGYGQYLNNQKEELRKNIKNVLDIVNKKV